MMGYLTIQGQQFEWHECITCGVIFTVPAVVAKQQRETGGFHHCSNGHQQGWSKDGSEVERIRRERDRLKQRLAEKDDEIEHQKRRAAAQFGENTKLRKRVGNGVCPCCTRSFTNLRAHMRTKHPDFKAPTELKVVA